MQSKSLSIAINNLFLVHLQNTIATAPPIQLNQPLHDWLLHNDDEHVDAQKSSISSDNFFTVV
jgi:cysteinyl-tRNA synthetase